MTIKEKFKAYYFPWLIAMGIMFGIKFAIGLFDEEQRQRVISLEGLLLLFGLIITLTVFCGGVFHWFFEVYRPKRVIKLYNRIRNLDLQEFGLKADEAQNNFNGYYKGYYLTVLTDSSPSDGEWVKVNAFIIPNETQLELYERLQKKFEFNTDEGLFWFTSKTKMKFGRTPKKEKLTSNINELVDALRFERIEPLLVTE